MSEIVFLLGYYTRFPGPIPESPIPGTTLFGNVTLSVTTTSHLMTRHIKVILISHESFTN